jgi:hypothetical protein
MPRNDWILDVLADLKAYAASNGLVALAEQLDDTKLIAAAEIASRTEEVAPRNDGELGQPGSHTGAIGLHKRA